MKIAVLNTNGVQETEDGMLEHYFSVSDNYDFNANDATDVTSVSSLKLLLKSYRIDLIKLRDSSKLYLLPDWNNLSDEDKKYLVSVYIYPITFTQGDIDLLFTETEQLNNWKNLVDITKQNRDARWDYARQKISFYLTTLEILDLYTSTKSYKGDYEDANLPYLVLWITNGSYPAFGIDFTSNGFAQKTYYTVALRDLLVDILVSGNLN